MYKNIIIIDKEMKVDEHSQNFSTNDPMNVIIPDTLGKFIIIVIFIKI
jgi:hypothetical protein